ncbi:MAG: Phosphoenolpyruvate synthase [uncultured Pyrinomonadaceae bacterium]|uniref:Phosphoenolpyruvate synthase n=1 Tax=uncultured Pyrinomonadaceae bacterium TaxID=2283094 RepID=A0A6J4PSX0_9BACT|nr:MAG: Phosphoenolpyruvate synthase [uncultured Pyrinomonadaceae bacterium]
MKSKISLFLIVLCFTPTVFAQMSRKPTAARASAGAMPKKPDSAKRFINQVDSQEAFDQIARTYHQNTPYALPHAMFVIDRRHKNKIYYVNSQKYRFHKDFLLANYLVARGGDVYETIYIRQDRRFIVGTVAWQKTVEKFTFELYEGDTASAELIKLAYDVINETFFADVAFKPNSSRQDDATAALGINRVTADEIQKNQEYLALNTGKAVGRIHIIEKLDDTVEIGDNEILILKELPLNLPPVRGIIVAKPSTPLSHVNILAKGWGIPNVYIKDADKLFKELDTFVVELEANLTDYNIKRADLGTIKEKYLSPDETIAPSNLTVTKLAALRQMRKKDSIVYGAKSANLGEMMSARIPTLLVPDGFTVPFHWYDRFMRENKFNDRIDEFLDDLDFVHNPRVRRQKLEAFRAEIQNGEFDEKLKAEIIARWKTQLRGQPVFVRSSSNAEDLPNFSGAGLYSSVANVRGEEEIIRAVKKVWSSLWNFDAYEARVRNYVNQREVYMSALIQVGVNMQSGGVLITKDPFDPENENAVYVAAVWGHNEGITANKFVPEQVLYNQKSNAIQILTLSQQESILKFGEGGDLIETNEEAPPRRVLTDKNVRELVRVAGQIKRIFGGVKEQDIEWGMLNGRLYILQARPYFEK